MPDKLTDNEIVKALEYEANEKVCIHEVYEPACGMWCKHLHLWCTDFNGNSNKNNCSAFKPTATNKRTKAILDLINRLQAENKRLTTLAELGNTRANDYRVMRDRALKAEEENERLKEEKSKLENKIDEIYPLVMQLPNAMQQAKAEAYKEFAKRLNNKGMLPHEINDDYAVGLETIDKLLKELVGESNV